MKKMLARAVGLALCTLGPVGAADAGTNPAPAQADASAIDPTLFHAQVILDRLGFSPGIIDGRPGKSMAAALKGFEESRGLPITGELGGKTLAALKAYRGTPPLKTIALTADMLAGPYVNPIPRGEDAQARLPALGYRSPMEKLGEMFHTSPAVLIALNGPATRLAPGTPVKFPNVVPAEENYDPKLPDHWRATLVSLNVGSTQPQAAKIVVDKSDQVLRVLDANGKLVAQFMVTTGSSHDPLPIGTWKIYGADYNPKFHYNPALFWDAKKGDASAMLPPGPNGPVGVVWLDLSKEHYGIHGTPSPENIGRTESHGCVRLANWDAARLAMMVKPGTPAVFQP